MSRGRRRPVTSLLSLWQESERAHHCEQLREAIADAIYEIMETTARGKKISRRKYQRRRVLVVMPNHPDGVPMRDRVRWCPFCGHKVALVDAPPRQRRGQSAAVPDSLPEDL